MPRSRGPPLAVSVEVVAPPLSVQRLALYRSPYPRLTSAIHSPPPRRFTMTAITFDDYLRHFDYDERVAMKIQLPELLKLYAEGQVQLVDIRFHEEYAAWRVGIGQHIPLNELPDRLDELDATKTIVTMCPHYDRAEIARLYLALRGYRAR
jgi:rhodanese-related sulfurtransferase